MHLFHDSIHDLMHLFHDFGHCGKAKKRKTKTDTKTETKKGTKKGIIKGTKTSQKKRGKNDIRLALVRPGACLMVSPHIDVRSLSLFCGFDSCFLCDDYFGR